MIAEGALIGIAFAVFAAAVIILDSLMEEEA